MNFLLYIYFKYQYSENRNINNYYFNKKKFIYIFFLESFESVANGTNVLLREYEYIISTKRNKAYFIHYFHESFKNTKSNKKEINYIYILYIIFV